MPEGLDLYDLGERFLDLDISEQGEPGKPPETTQPLRTDQATGHDQLQIVSEVNAIVDAVMTPAVEPPLVVGVLGGWGSGKSFVLHLLKERLSQIRLMDVSEPSAPAASAYVGHPYLVHFDAWTYAKSDLWASLMQKVLLDLDRQLTLEQNLTTAGVRLEEGFDLWAVIDDLSDKRLKSLETELGLEALENVKKWRSGETTGRSVWSELQGLHQRELENLKTSTNDLNEVTKQQRQALLAEQTRIAAEDRAAEATFTEQLRAIIATHEEKCLETERRIHQVKEELEEEAAKQAERDARREGWEVVGSQLSGLFGKAMAEAAPDEDVPPISKTIGDLNAQAGIFRRYRKGLTLEAIIFLIVALGGGLILGLPQIQNALADAAGLLASVGGVLASAYTAFSKYTERLVQIQTEFEERRNNVRTANEARNAETLKNKIDVRVAPLEAELVQFQTDLEADTKSETTAHDTQLEDLRKKHQTSLEQLTAEQVKKRAPLEHAIERHRQRAGAVGRSTSLHELIRSRVENGDYEAHLGLVHQVQCDLLELTEALMPIGGVDRALFPRGNPRLILIIDDLDRCPPEEVVKVLEAAQLLVKTRLFVVVLAMDVRYVTKALEQKYKGILVTDGDPSGLDYIEKIVQIPYRVRPISREAMDGYLRSQMDIKAEESGGPGMDSNGGEDNETAPGATISSPATQRVNESLPPEVQTFEITELEMIKNSSLAAELSPRSTKRVVNVMKLVKNIWYRRGIVEPGEPAKRAIVFLLALSAGYPEVLRRLLLDLERELRRPKRIRSAKLVTVLTRLVVTAVNSGVLKADWDSVRLLIKDEQLLSSDLTADNIGLANVELVRSFSFVGEVDRPPDPVVHDVGIDFRGPLTVDGPASSVGDP